MLIYKITNKINGKVYIGQTTRTLSERIQGYKKEYKWKSNSRPIIRAMNKYGFENFEFSIIEEDINSKEQLDEKEKYYIKKYKSLCSQKGYNVELGGNGVGKHSEETKKKIGQAQLGEKNHMFGVKGYGNQSSKEVIELTTGQRFGSASVAAEELKLGFSHVCAVARGERGSTGGYVFRYLDKNGDIIQPQSCAKIKSLKTRNSIKPEFKHLIP